MKLLKTEEEVKLTMESLRQLALAKGKAVSFNELFYSLLSKKIGDVSVGRLLKEGETITNDEFYSLLLVKAMPNCRLVKANLRRLDMELGKGFSKRFPYAWVESDEFVYDVSSKSTVNRKWFYKTFKPEKDLEIFSLVYDTDSELFIESMLAAVKNRPELVDLVFKCPEFKEIDPQMIKAWTTTYKDRALREKIVTKSEEFHAVDVKKVTTK